MTSAARNGDSRSAAPALPAAGQRAGSRPAGERAGACRCASNGLAAARNMKVNGGVGVGAGSAGDELQAEGAAELDLRGKWWVRERWV